MKTSMQINCVVGAYSARQMLRLSDDSFNVSRSIEIYHLYICKQCRTNLDVLAFCNEKNGEHAECLHNFCIDSMKLHY